MFGRAVLVTGQPVDSLFLWFAVYRKTLAEGQNFC